jgi:hypothetical protein
MGDMPEPVAEVFSLLCEDLEDLHYLWNTCTFLYNSDHFLDILNRAAPVFFSDHQMLLLECIALGAWRLLDRAQSGKRDNCSLDLLRARIEATGQHPDLCSMLRYGRDAARKRGSALIKLRHRRFGHRDHEFAVKGFTAWSVRHCQLTTFTHEVE